MNERKNRYLSRIILKRLFKQRFFRLFEKLKQEGLDCGDEIGEFLRQFLDTTDKIRLLYYINNLYSERDVVSEEDWLLGSVPKIRAPVSHFTGSISVIF